MGLRGDIMCIQNKCLHTAFRVIILRNVSRKRGEHELLKTALCAVLSSEVSARITMARTVTETAVTPTAAETIPPKKPFSPWFRRKFVLYGSEVYGSYYD